MATRVTYLERSWWTDRPPHGHRVPHSQFIGLAVHHTVFVMADWDGDGILHGDLDDIKRYMERLRTARPDLGADVPYSFVVFPGATPGDGIVVEGRGPGQTGAHTHGFNSTRYGVAFAGNTMVEAVTPGVVAAFRAVGERLFDPAGAARTFGHRDHGQTLCPGDHLYVELPQLQPPFLPNLFVPEEDDTMKALRIVGFRQFGNRWLIGAGPALNLSGELADSYRADGVQEVLHDQVHDQLLHGLLEQSGLDVTDLAAP
ncbi:MAG: hypothetical protein AB7G37_03415 [Solirubrobacteraceae bacterium]